MPDLGEHTDDVLEALGYSSGDIDRLRAEDVNLDGLSSVRSFVVFSLVISRNRCGRGDSLALLYIGSP